MAKLYHPTLDIPAIDRAASKALKDRGERWNLPAWLVEWVKAYERVVGEFRLQ